MDFSEPGYFKINRISYIKETVKDFTKNNATVKKYATPA